VSGHDERMSRMFRVIDEALERPESEREAYVRQVCGDEPGLAEDVIAGISPSEDVLAVLNAKDTSEPPDALIGREIEGFHIEALISEGGMGAVYRAVDTGLQRPVALKFVHAHQLAARFGTAQRSRFRREILTLAKLDDPGIAKVFEDPFVPVIDGVPRPFFAMEFIDGEPISTFVRRTKPDARRVIALVADAGAALAHAHSRGVIHRDIKPTNVLVTRTGAVKLIDFGIAKSFDDDDGTAAAATSLTMDGGRSAGTLEYMSPEQLQTPDDLDIRTDVYSLGVVAYELLTATRAFDLRGFSLVESARRVLEVMPPTMSSVNPRLRGDIETMVQTAMERDRARRYQSAGEFVADLKAFLEDRPITARRPSTAYRLRKFAKRNPGVVTAAAAGAVALGVSITALAVISAKNREIIVRTAEVERINEQYVNKGFELTDAVGVVFTLSGPEEDWNPQEAVDFYEERLTVALDGLRHAVESPDAVAAIRRHAADTFLGWGAADKAEEQYKLVLDLRREQYGEAHPDTAAAEASLGFLYLNTNRMEEAEKLLVQATTTLRAERHPRWRIEAAAAIDNLARVRHAQGRLEDGAALYVEELAIRRAAQGVDHVDTAKAEQNYAALLMDLGRYGEAEAIGRRILAVFSREFGDTSPEAAFALRILGMSLRLQGKNDEALEVLRRAVTTARDAKEVPPGLVLSIDTNLGLALLETGGDVAATESEEMLRTAVEKWNAARPAGDSNTAEATAGWSRALVRLGKIDEAAQALGPAWERAEQLERPPRLMQQAMAARIELAEAITKRAGASGETAMTRAASAEELAEWRRRLAAVRGGR
jgi:eukaryotic-like serine/threonine-protein kinase